MSVINLQKAYLVLEDGTFFEGKAIGKIGTTSGEIAFNTGMTGYQEVFTDPSYFGQILIMTMDHIGNYGVRNEDAESGSIKIAGLVCKNYSPMHSRTMANSSLNDYFIEHGFTGISDVDTRQIVKHIRDAGAMNAIISSEILDVEVLARMVKEVPSMEGLELSSKVWSKESYEVNPEGTLKVALLDLGSKENIIRCLTDRGCHVKVFPGDTSYSNMKSWNPDGYMISNGPGDPSAMSYAVKTLKDILDANEKMFGICLGSQILAQAVGMKTFKLHSGHRGQNHPVKNLQMRAFSRLASRKLAKAFQIWKMYANTKRYENPAKAIVHYDSHLAPKILKRTFLAWRKVKDDKKRLRRIETDSINKRDLKALKDTITFWHKKTVARRLALGQERKLDRAILFRERSKMRYAFRAWRTLAFAEKLRDETLVRTLKTKGDYERHFVQPFMRWKLISEQRRLITEKIEQRNRIDLLRVAFVSWKRSTKDAHIRLVLTEKFIAQKNRKKQMQVQRDILLAWNTFVGTLKQTRIEQMKRAVVERAIADESVTHFGTPEGIAIVQAAKRFHRRNFLERVLSVVFQKWREESARRNTILLALQSAFVEENDARRLRVAFRMWRERAVEMRSARESILIASKSPLKKKDNSMRISREGRGNYQERSSTSSASWDFDIDFEANTRNLKSLNDKATLIKKVQGQMTMFVDNTNNASNNRFSALDRSYRDTIEACIALEAKLELKQGIISTPPARKMTNTVPTTRASREHMQNALKERLMDIETSAMVLLESARATRVRRENEKASLVLK